MAKSSLTFWIDVETSRVLDGFGSNNEAPSPTFVAGDTTDVEIHLVRKNASSQFEELPLDGKSFKLAIGLIDRKPSGGFWTLAYGNSQIDFDYNESAESVQTALNLIPEIIADGGVTVSLVNAETTYRVVFNNKVAISSSFTTDASNLLPSSIVQKNELKVGSSTTKGVWHFKPKQVPVAYQPNWTTSANSSVATLTSLGNGVKRLSISPNDPQGGTFTLNATKVNTKKFAPNQGQVTTEQVTTFPISVNATEADFDNAFPEFPSATSQNPNGITVKKVGAYAWDFTTQSVDNAINGAFWSSYYDITSVASEAIIPFSYVYATISLNNYEVSSLLAGLSEAEAVLEVEMTENGSVTTILQTSCKIVNDIIGQTTFVPTPFDDPVTQSDLDAVTDSLGEMAYEDDAPSDGSQYARKDGDWVAVELDGNNIPDYDNGLTYSVGSQVYFQGKLYRMTNAVGGAGYDPVSYPSYWESLSGTSPDLSGYALKSGTTFTGKVNLTAVAGVAGLNLGVGGTTASSTIAGDLWLPTGSTILQYRDATGVQRNLAGQNLTNTFSSPQIVQTANASPALRVTQTGTGEALRVEDEANPDTTPFVVGADGRVGIHGTPATNTAHKLAIYNGNLLFSSGFGIAFGDGTFQTTASGAVDLTGYATESWVTGLGYLTIGDYPIYSITNASHKQHRASCSGTATIQYFDGFTQTWNDLTITVVSPNSSEWDGWAVVFNPSVTLGSVSFDYNNKILTLGTQSTTQTLEDAVNTYTGSSTAMPSGWQATFSGSSVYASSNDLNSTFTISAPLVTTLSGANVALVGGVFPELTADAKLYSENNKVLGTDNYGNAGWRDFSGFGFALLSGATFTGKVNTPASTISRAGINIGAGSSPTSPLAGDLWFQSSSNFLHYRSPASANTFTIPTHQFTNTFSAPQIIDTTSNTLAGLRITQKGTNNAIVVEDSTSPDTTSFVVNANGIVGINVNPATWVPATGVVLDVNGKGVFTSTATLAGINVGTVTATPTTLVNGDIWIGTSLNFRGSNGFSNTVASLGVANQFSNNQIIQASTTLPLLRVTQGGTGHALVVEDSNPDTDAFVIDQNGNVGVGVNSSTWVPTAKLEVGTGGIKFQDGSVQTSAPTATTTTNARFPVVNTQYLTPNTGHWMMMSPNIIQIQRAGFNVTNTGTITTTNQGWISSYTQVGTAGACSSRWRTFGLSQVDQVWSLTDKSIPQSNFDFSNRSWCSGRSVLLGVTESVFTWGFYHGKHGNSDGVGDLVRRGYGWKVTGGAGDRFISLEVHDGTTLTSVTSTYAVTNGVAFDWDIQSSGGGQVTLWINGTQRATTGGGPTGSTNLVPVVWSEEVSTSGASVGAFNGMVHSRGKFIAFDS